MKNKLILNSILGLTIACPSFAAVDISKNASDPGCTNSVLKTYDGPAALEADYTANTINLKWYGADGEITTVPNASKTCTYDGSITLPTTDPTRTGYTFDGWKVRVPSPFKALLDQSVLGTMNDFFTHNGTNECKSSLGGGIYRSCDNPEFSGLNSNEFKVVYENGTIYGEASCNNVEGSSVSNCAGGPCIYTYNNDAESADTFSTVDSGEYCWCRLTGYEPANGVKQTVLTSKWIYFNGGQGAFTRYGNTSSCSAECVGLCSVIKNGNDLDGFWITAVNATE